MNTQKLNELAASAMGWIKATDPVGNEGWLEGDIFHDWVPNFCEDLNDASALLEKVAGNDWDCEKIAPDLYACYCGENPQGSTAKTLCEAIVLQSLRASGIPESSITEATNEK